MTVLFLSRNEPPAGSTFTPQYRLNVGGDLIVASPNWEQDFRTYQVGTTGVVQTWDPPGVLPVGGAPAELFLQELGSLAATDDEIREAFRLPVGDHKIRVFSAASGTSAGSGGVFDIRVKVGAAADAVVSAARDVYAEVGDTVGWMYEYPLTISGSTTTVEVAIRRTSAATRSPKLHGIEILSTVVRPVPQAPTLSGVIGDTSNTLTWNRMPGATAYDLRRSTTSGGAVTVIGADLTVPTYTHTGLTNGVPLYYTVRGKNENGSGTVSNEVALTPAAAGGGGLGTVETWWATDELLAAWRLRANGTAVNGGKYVVKSDTSTGSPADWSRIVTDKNAFMAAPNSYRWPGLVGWRNEPATGCIIEPTEGGEADFQMDYAAIVNSAQAAATLAEQVNYQDTSFQNRARWCVSNVIVGQSVVFAFVGDFVATCIVTYDLLIAYEQAHSVTLWTAAQKTAFKNWAVGFADWAMFHIDAWLDQLYSNRTTMTLNATGTAPGNQGIIYDNGPAPLKASVRYQNRSARGWRAAAMAYILAGNATGITRSKRYLKEALAFTVYPSPVGALADFQRGSAADNSKGWKYSVEVVGAMVTVAEALRRQAIMDSTTDTELWDYSTVVGTTQTDGNHWTGGPKTLKKTCEDMTRWLDKTFNETIGGVRIRPGLEWVHELCYMHGNRYMQSTLITEGYTRTSVGADAYPDPPNQGKFVPWRGDCGLFPGAHFMFGKLEGT
jgi:hypothetical protein